MEKEVSGGEVFNIGAGHNVTIKAIAEMIGGPIQYVEARLEPKASLADNSKARNILGWIPEVNIEEGVGELKKIAGLI